MTIRKRVSSTTKEKEDALKRDNLYDDTSCSVTERDFATVDETPAWTIIFREKRHLERQRQSEKDTEIGRGEPRERERTEPRVRAR